MAQHAVSIDLFSVSTVGCERGVFCARLEMAWILQLQAGLGDRFVRHWTSISQTDEALSSSLALTS